MLNLSANKLKAIFYVSIVGLSAYMAISILDLSWATSSLPTSDYFGVFARYLAFMSGKLSFTSYIFLKHVDHNHALVYLLSLVDILVDNGQLYLLHGVQIASNIAVYGIIVYLIFKLDVPDWTKGAMLLFVSSQIFAIQGSETWVFPFQVVLASFRLLFVVGILLFCREIISSDKQDQSILLAALFILLVAALSHGSGIVIFPLLLTLCVIWGDRKITLFTLAFSIIFVVHELIYPSNTPLTELVTRIPFKELFISPYYLMFLLGNSFAWGLPDWLQVLAGTLGVIFWGAMIWKYVIAGKKSELSNYKLFLLAWSTFSLVAGFLSVLLNLSYMKIRGVSSSPPLEYFLASRYLITISGFWIGIGLTGAQHLLSWKRVIFAILFIASAMASVWQGQTQEVAWKQVVDRLKFGEILESTGYWKHLPDRKLREIFMLPKGFPSKLILDVLKAQEQRKLGPYAPHLVKLNNIYAVTSPANLSDSNWNRGIAKRWAGFIMLNLPENRRRLTAGKKIRFNNRQVRVISKQEASGIYLNVFLGGPALNGSKVGFPNRFEVIK